MMTYSEINQTYDLNDDNEIRKLEMHDALESTWLLRSLKRTSIIMIGLALYVIVGFLVYTLSLAYWYRDFYIFKGLEWIGFAIDEFPSMEYGFGCEVIYYGDDFHWFLNLSIIVAFTALICASVYWVMIGLATRSVYKRERKILDVI